MMFDEGLAAIKAGVSPSGRGEVPRDTRLCMTIAVTSVTILEA